MSTDVFIAGAGPAALAAAAACARKGLTVAMIAPNPDANWVPTYAAWYDDVTHVGLVDVPFDATWHRLQVHLVNEEVRDIKRTYGRVDKSLLQNRLRTMASDVVVHRGSVVAITETGAGSTVRDDRGRLHQAAVVIDATGATEATAFQTAFGVLALPQGLVGADARWMDFSIDFDDGHPVPSFLYALPFPDGRWLLEETVLVHRPAVPHTVLARRLRSRLEQMGVTLHEVQATERCTIAMNARPTMASNRVLFGAAAAMTHPATGYLLARVLNTAPALADALAIGLATSPAHARRLAHKAIWPGSSARRHRLLRYAASAIDRLDPQQTRAFFATFFAMPDAFRDGFLSDRLTTGELVRGMTTLFASMPNRLRWRILSRGHPTELVRAALESPTDPGDCPMNTARTLQHEQPPAGLSGSGGLDECLATMVRLIVGRRLDRAGRAAHAHLETGGKRMRARLALAAAEALGVDRLAAVPWAAACELLHQASLVHDDIQDGDPVRRGKPAVWAEHGVAVGINTGDLLLMLPALAIAELSAQDDVKWRLSLLAARRAEETVRGQALDLDNEHNCTLEWDRWLATATGKSGALLALPVEGAAVLAGLSDASANALAHPFCMLGVLYQAVDDWVDLYGDKGRGQRGNDLREGKTSLLVVEHLRLHPGDRERLSALLRVPRHETTDADVAYWVDRFAQAGAMAAAVQRIDDLERTIRNDVTLRSVPDLHALVEPLVERVRKEVTR